MRADMTRIAMLLLLVVVGSAHAAFMKGTLTLDDGRTATLTVRHFQTRGSYNVSVRAAEFRCSGDACFTPIGNFGYELPFMGGYDLQFDNPIFGPRYYHCGTQALGLKHAGVCRIESRVACLVEDSSMNPLFQVVATGMLDVHRTTPSCQRILRRAGQ
jgi:hypothetical protein